MLRTPCLFFAVLAQTLCSAGWAADTALNAYARLLLDDTAVNQGAALDLLVPLAAKPWSNPAPFATTPANAEIWFPTLQAPHIASLAWTTRYDAVGTVQVQQWDGATWQNVTELPVTVDARGLRRAAQSVVFSPPLVTRGLRLRLSDIANCDHDVLQIADWLIQGAADAGAQLFASTGLEVSTTATFNSVDLPAAVPVVVSLRSGGLATALRVEVACTTPGGADAGLPVQTWNCDLHGDTAAPVVHPLSLAFPVQGPYAVTVSVWDRERGVRLAVKRLLVGVRDPALAGDGVVEPLEPPGPPQPSLSERIAQQGTIWGCELTQCTLGLRRIPGESAFRTIKAAGGEQVFTVMRYEDFEPLPGVYNLATFDRLVEQASATGLGLTLGFWRWDFDGPTQYWLRDELMWGSDGKPAAGWNNQFSVFSPRYRQLTRRAVEILVGRYLNSPAVWAWHPHPYGMVDHDGHGITDTSPAALHAWAAFLEQRYHTLAALNAAHQGDYRAWDAVPVPIPRWQDLEHSGDWDASCRVLDVRPAWIDWLDCYHDGLESIRRDMMATVRRLDPRRGIDGTNASSGIGHADRAFADLREAQAFSGDQALNNLNHLRRFIAKRRYGLPLRLEDIAPVTIGRSGLDERTIIDRCDWDMFQLTTLGADHFSYVFPVWDASPFWDRVFANPRAKALVKEAQAAEIPVRNVGWLHSFVSDVLVGRYHYEGISIQRWWQMGGWAAAQVTPGQWMEPFSDGGPLTSLSDMQVVVDDGSRVLPGATVDRLLAYVAQGGRLVLTGDAGERTIDRPAEHWELLRRLGYPAPEQLEQCTAAAATVVLKAGNPVFRRTISFPVQQWAGLQVPPQGTLLGTVGEQPGAVLWAHGKGAVVLIAGVPGSISEIAVQQMMNARIKQDAASKALMWGLWGNAEREQGGIAGRLLGDVAEWAGVAPQCELDDGFQAVLRQRGETRILYLYNQGPERIPVLRLPLPPGRTWRVTAESLESTVDLGTASSTTAWAPGLALPQVGSKRFLAVRIVPAP